MTINHYQNSAIQTPGAEIANPLKRTSTLLEMIDRVKNEPKLPMIYSAIKEGSVGLVYGVAKTGKTIFCENLGMSIAAGRTAYLNKPINIDNRKVLFLSLEEFYQSRTERNIKQIEVFNPQERKLLLENYIVANESLPKVLHSKDDWKIIQDEIENHKPGIVIIDSLTRIVDGQIENSEVAKNAMLNLRALAEKCKVTILVIHHSTKMDYTQPMTQLNVAGSRIISQESDFILGINKTYNNQRYIKLVSARYTNDNYNTVANFDLNKNLWVEIIGTCSETKLLMAKEDGRKNNSNADIIKIYLQEAYGQDVVTTGDLVKKFVSTGTMSEPTLHASLKKLEEMEQMIKVDQGKYRLLT